MGMYCFCIITVVTCKLNPNLTNVTSVENNWREITFGCFRTSRKELMKEFKQLHCCLCGFDLGDSSIGTIWHHLLVYLLWQFGNQKWTFTLHPFTKCSFIQLMSKRFIAFYFIFFLVPCHRFFSFQSVSIKRKLLKDWLSACSQKSEEENISSNSISSKC